MHILVLGGSNAGVSFGWAKTLARILPEHDIENCFLGAVGSLFGLLLLLKRRRESQPKPDVVIFEYALNDAILLDGSGLDAELLREALKDVITICAQDKLPLLFLCLASQPRDDGNASPNASFVNSVYLRATRENGLASPLLLTDILGELSASDYVDSVHLAEGPSLSVAEAIAQRLARHIPVPKPSHRSLSFTYVDATEARSTAALPSRELTSRVFHGPFIELSRGEATYWPSKGRLVSIMLLSNASSGYYRIGWQGAAIRKNAQSLMRDIIPDLMMMYYVTSKPLARGEIVIDMPACETELMALPEEPTLMECAPSVPFAEQTLLVNGLLFHHKPSRIVRALQRAASLFRVARAY